VSGVSMNIRTEKNYLEVKDLEVYKKLCRLHNVKRAREDTGAQGTRAGSKMADLRGIGIVRIELGISFMVFKYCISYS
jgi:hypothetical protein